MTNGSTLCSLMYTSISTACHVKTVPVIYKKLLNQFNYLLKYGTKVANINIALCVTYAGVIQVWYCWLDNVKYID